MNPKRLDTLFTSVLNMSGFDLTSGSVKVPSIAYRMSQPLKMAALLAKGDALQVAYQAKVLDLTKVEMFGHFVNEITSRWSRSIGKIATNTKRGAAADKVQSFALEEGIVKFCSYFEGSYRKLKRRLENEPNDQTTYNILMTYLISHIMCLVRRRPVNFKRASLLHYSLLDQQDDLIDMAKNSSNSEENLNNIGSEELAPNVCLRKMKSKVSLKSPKTFNNNGLKHHAATFSKLHSSHPQYQDFLASVLGHTLNIDKKHYELPTSVLQKMVICPILYGMTKQSQTSIDNPETDNQCTNQIEENQRSTSK